ncbi:phage tail tape measure protein, core region [compost metagenome]
MLRREGGLSSAELAQAQVRLRERTADLVGQTNGWARSLGDVRMQAGVAVASIGGLLYAGGNLLSFYAQFAQQMAAVDSITDMSREQLQAMARDVRDLSVAMGRDAAQSAAALNDILSSGVSESNGIAVLEQSTKAAIAGITDTQTAAAGGLAIVNAYGEGIENLGLRYDQMFLAVRDGVTTFPELAKFIGDVLPTARAAGVGFDEVSAAIARMTISGIRTPQATTALKGAINALAAPTPDAQKKMDELGISWRGLVGTLEDIASRNLGIAAMRELIPDVEARTAVLSLTQDIAAMRAEVEAMGNAGGAMEAAYTKMANTPQAELDKFNATWAELKLQLGEAATAFLPVIQLAGGALTAFNGLPEPVRNTVAAVVAFSAAATVMAGTIAALRNPFALFLGHLSQTPGTAGAAGQALGGFGGRVGELIPRLRTLADVAKLAKAGLALGVIEWTGGNLMELYDLYQQNEELTQSQRDYEQSLLDTIATTTKYADVVIQPAEALVKMTEAERRAYAERLRLAEQHYRAQMDLQSRRDMENLGPTAPVTQEALASARRASEFREAQRAIGSALAEREAAEGRHATNLAKIKADQLKSIQTALAAEIRLYDDATKKVEAATRRAADAQKRRADLAKEFAALGKELRGTGADGEPTLGTATALKAGARQALQRGDSAEAIRQAREAGEILRDLKASGANSYGFAGMADELARIADEAARLDEVAADVGRIKAQEQVDQIKARMDELLAKAEAFKRLNIEFTGFEQSAAQLEAQALALAERLKAYMVIPVNYIGADGQAITASEKQAGEMIEPVKRATGGWLDGPGSPTSDSILFRGSRSEFVLQARAAQRLGAANLDFMNRTGELPPSRAALIPSIPTLPQLDRMGERQPLNLAMPWGGSYALEGSPAEVERFSRDLKIARHKFGSTRG